MNPQSVIVVGAGITGLTCAYRLKQLGRTVTVIESAPRVGGVIQTRVADGFLLEEGPNSFQSTPEMIDIIRETGLTGEMITAEPRLPRYIYYRGRLHPAPMGPGGLASTQLLSGAAKLRVFREFWIKPKQGDDEETVSEFVTRRFGREALQNLVAPFLSGVYAGDPDRLSIRSVFPSLVEFERDYGSVLKGVLQSSRKTKGSRAARNLCSFRRGLHSLPSALAAAIGSENILLNAQAERIETKSDGGKPSLMIHVKTQSERRGLAAEAVVLSAPAYRGAELVASLSESLARELRAIEYPSLSVIYVTYKRSDIPHALEGFGFLVPRNEGVRLLGCVWSSALFSGRAPAGLVLFTAFAGGAADPDVASWSEQEIVEMLRQDFRATLGIDAPPTVIAIQRHARAIPQYTIGHAARCQRMENELKSIPGLSLAGNYLHGVSLGDCVKQGNELAFRIQDSGFRETNLRR
jgi:oxygen-dependent protoporphyrinogen oxidase